MDNSFALLTESFVFLPTPSSANVKGYRTLFRKLHADPAFCSIAFGEDFKPIIWSDDEVKEFLLSHDAAQRWGRRSMGDFALGLLPNRDTFDSLEGRLLKGTDVDVKIIEGTEFEKLKSLNDGLFFEQIEWAGYTCVRDATTSSVEDLYSNPSPPFKLPPWQDMIEIRYGLDEKHRGRGFATKTARIIMQWGVEERGTTCFIAETEKANTKSGFVLERLGFRKSGTKYFQDDSLDEWERVVSQ